MTATSPRLAVSIIEELIRAGVRDVALAPGSRSAPLALALADAERQGLLRLHVRIDERSAAYLALGIARESGTPSAVVTTSGTAAVNLHPAVVEAAYSGVPLIAVTADRPGVMRGSGANQTIDQRNIFADDPVDTVDLEGLTEDEVRKAVAHALSVATGHRSGPVHLNVPLAEPLVAAGEHRVNPGAAGEVARSQPAGDPLMTLLPAGVSPDRGLLVVGDFDDPDARERAAELADALGWPIISEPSGNLTAHGRSLRHGPLIAGPALEIGLIPDVVVSVGRVGLHRSVMALIRAAAVHIAVDVPPRLGRVDPARTALAVVEAVPLPSGQSDAAWWARWHDIDTRAAGLVDASMADGPLSGPMVARIVASAAAAEDAIVIGPSWPVRHVSSYAGPLRARCIANRGTSGIDGVMSTAWGVAIAHRDSAPDGTTYALVGDLTAVYDRNGLITPESEVQPRLVYVVADNDGGGIFSSLEQGSEEFADDFERVFGTPLGADTADLLRAPRVEVTTVESADALRSELRREHAGVRVIVARCLPRPEEARLVSALAESVDAAIT